MFASIAMMSAAGCRRNHKQISFTTKQNNILCEEMTYLEIGRMIRKASYLLRAGDYGRFFTYAAFVDTGFSAHDTAPLVYESFCIAGHYAIVESIAV